MQAAHDLTLEIVESFSLYKERHLFLAVRGALRLTQVT
jgi:hypothetical protein